MAVFLERIDSAPILNTDLDAQLLQWIAHLVDSLNESLRNIQNAILSYSSVSAITQDVQINSIYTPTNVALTALQLPDKSAVGSRVTIAGFGAGGWILLTGTGQTIKVADVGASAATSVASSSRYDSIEIICVVADTTWITLSTQTTGFVIL